MPALIDLGQDRVLLELMFLQTHAYLMEQRAIGREPAYPPPNSREELRRSGETFIGEQREGALIAALSYVRRTDAIEVRRLMVHPDHVRQGLATMLLQELENKTAGEPRLLVTACVDNLPAMRLYQRFGFRELDRFSHSSGVEMATLEKILSG